MLSTWVTPACASSSMFLGFQLPPPPPILSVTQDMSMPRSARLPIRLPIPRAIALLKTILILRHLPCRPPRRKGKGRDLRRALGSFSFFSTLKFRISNRRGVTGHFSELYFPLLLKNLPHISNFYPLDNFSHPPIPPTPPPPEGFAIVRRARHEASAGPFSRCNPATAPCRGCNTLPEHSSPATFSEVCPVFRWPVPCR